MEQELKAEDFTSGFNYSVRSGEMSLNFFCDCCGNEVKVSFPYNKETQNQQRTFDLLKKEMHGKFHRCVKCGLLVCQECWDKRESKCVSCPVCIADE